ncbi:MAG: RibD family protein, partial [Verrucomicrobiae bacterium]
MKRPFVLAHFAMTADGKISTRAGTPSRFTSVADKRRLLEARAEADAVLAGRGTVEADAMSMGISAKDLREARAARGLPPVPLRVIVSNAGRFDLDGKVFRYSASPLVIFSTTRMPERLRPEVARRAELFLFRGREVDLSRALEILRAEFGVKRLVCEGGGALLRSLAGLGLVDGIRLTVAPVIFGGRLAPSLTGLPGSFLLPPREFRITRQTMIGDECCLELIPSLRNNWTSKEATCKGG